MVTHFIFMSSSYSLGTRIALDYILKFEKIKSELKATLDMIVEECGKDVSISTHMIQAENETWEAVCEADYFFKDVKIIDNVDEFIKLIKADRTLKGIDVAKYILSRFTCTQLKLQKLVYYCFADYLCNTGKRLFTDKVYAFKYGPVVETVYKKYKKYGYKDIDEEIETIDNKNISEMPARSRILFAESGTEKMMSIDRTLKKYGELTASELVNLTHSQNSPWTETPKGMLSQIELETIKEYHQFEQI